MNKQKKLSTWAKENNLPYKTVWNQYSNGTLPVKTKETKTGRIFVIESNASDDNLIKDNLTFATPMMTDLDKPKNKVSIASDSVRSNRVANHPENTNQFSNIEKGVSPFTINDNTSEWDIKYVLELVQKAYYNFSAIRNIIDTMTDFSISKIYFRDGNARNRQFFTDLLESVNIQNFQDKFYREYYRSCNAFIYRFESIPQNDDLLNLNKAYNAKAAKGVKLPSKYVILNPCDISVQANIAFANTMMFFKRLNGYEIHRLRYAAQNPDKVTSDEKNFLKSLPKITQDQIKAGAGAVIIPLDPDILYAVFYKRQDYEPLSVPWVWPVLKDIEWKAEMKAIDMAVSRTMNTLVLQVKMGYQGKNGEYMVDQKAIQAMQALFQSESVGKTLVTDFATEVTYTVPEVGNFLDPKKYQIVNEDIKMGLNYILMGSDSKFANQHIQVKLFIERLRQARESFLINFLIPEIKRISKAMGFKNYPTPYFEDIELKDEADFNRLIAQLYQYGLLTPEEAFTSIETGRIPTGEESIESQQEFKGYKDKGYYQPIVGGPANQLDVLKQTGKQQMDLQDSQQEHDAKIKTKELKHQADNPAPAPPPSIHINAPTKSMPQSGGRPNGTKSPQTTKKIKPSKASLIKHDVSKIKDFLILATELNRDIKRKLCEKHNIKELNKDQNDTADSISELVMINESPDKWKETFASYIDKPENKNQDRVNDIEQIAFDYQIDYYLASLLLPARITLENK